MQEKVIIKSRNCNTLIFTLTMLVVAVIVYAILASAVWWVICLSIAGGIALFGLIVHLIYSTIKLTVTDKKIYGTAIFGRRVDLPLDSVSAVGTAWMKSITITTSSGRISFNLIKNRDEIYSEIGKLLVERQNTKKETPAETNNAADELKKFKELLDSGVITQEEFDQKKKQLLGL